MATLRQRSMGRYGAASVYAPQQGPTSNTVGASFSGSASVTNNATGAAIVGIIAVLLVIGHYYWTRGEQGGR